eukprot:1159268-Pelagomonas_calceolata.AAC.15
MQKYFQRRPLQTAPVSAFLRTQNMLAATRAEQGRCKNEQVNRQWLGTCRPSCTCFSSTPAGV